MTRTQHLGAMVVLFTGALTGSVIGPTILGQPAKAQVPARPNVIRATRFEVLDNRGDVVALLSGDGPAGPQLRFGPRVPKQPAVVLGVAGGKPGMWPLCSWQSRRVPQRGTRWRRFATLPNRHRTAWSCYWRRMGRGCNVAARESESALDGTRDRCEWGRFVAN